jgi:hypothetical protein
LEVAVGARQPAVQSDQSTPLQIVLQHVHQDVGVDQHHQSSARSSFISASVRQGTSA